jgi:hypothetical protein
MGDTVEEKQGNTKFTYFIAYSLIILIALYLTASTIVSLIPVEHQTFTIIFTIAGGIPALTMLFKENYAKNKN